MQKIIRYHPAAESEVIESAEWYDGQRLGLGGEFLDEVDTAVAQIQTAPEAFGYLHADVRCHLLQKK